MTVLKWLLIVVAVGYVGGLAAMFFLQRAILFPIPSSERIAPAAAGFPQVEEHVLTTTDGEKIIVWHMPAKPGRPVILYFHGNGDYLAGFFARFRNIVADGTGIVAPAYRGYSGSSGKPSEQGLLFDAEATYGFATARYSPDQIVVWGFSLGSGVAVALPVRLDHDLKLPGFGPEGVISIPAAIAPLKVSAHHVVAFRNRLWLALSVEHGAFAPVKGKAP